MGFANPTLKRGANKHCAYGARRRILSSLGSCVEAEELLEDFVGKKLALGGEADGFAV